MFLKKVTKIKGVGRFRAGGVKGGEYARYALLYGGNARGKTTLCAILRSLQRGDPAFIRERESFGVKGTPEIELLLDSGPTKFSAYAWSKSASDVHIFDGHFISENVHGGDQIDTSHRRNHYRVVVGAKGVALATAIDDLDAKATAKQAEINAEKKALQQHVPAKMTLEAFLALAEEPDVDAALGKAASALKAAENAEAIAKRGALKPAPDPALPPEFEALVAKTLESVSADAATLVQEQIAKHKLHAQGEAWLSAGLRHVADDQCPFCGNSLAGNALVEAYQGYFSKAYAAFKSDLQSLRKETEQALSEASALRAQQAFKDAGAAVEFWRQYGEVSLELPGDIEQIPAALAALRSAALDRLDAKIAAPLDASPENAGFPAAAAAWYKIRKQMEACNAAMAAPNAIIAAIKAANETANKTGIQNEIARLTAVRTRHTEPVLSLAASYAALGVAKEQLMKTREAKKAELDAYDEAILKEHEAAINRHLALFGASFKLSRSTKNYVGKTPQSSYHIQFDDYAIDASKSEEGAPSFRTALSAGDRSTLALAFFLAQLERDDALADKIVVFDDPFTSLDEFRREVTAKAIIRVGEKASQVIVLSHDKWFLDLVRGKAPTGASSAHQISTTKGNSAIEAWDIDREVKEGYLQDHMALLEFAEGVSTDAKAMRTLMRPLLEKYVRYRFPNQIADGLWLGDMLKIIRDTHDHPLQPVYQEIDDINEYTAPFHHDPNTPFDADEVMTHVQRTLAVVGGC